MSSYFKGPVEVIHMGRTGAAAAADALDGAAGVTCFDTKGLRMTNTSHGWIAGSTLEIGGTTNYNGMRYLRAVAANYMHFNVDTFVAETFTTSDYVYPWIKLKRGTAWKLLQFEMHLSAASATSEDLTLDMDADKGSYYDTNLYTKDMNGVTDILWIPGEGKGVIFMPDDRLKLAWANSNTKNWGAKFIIQTER